MKKREKAARAEELKALKLLQHNKDINVDGGYALSSSDGSLQSGEDSEMREMRRERKKIANEMYNQEAYNRNKADGTLHLDYDNYNGYAVN